MRFIKRIAEFVEKPTLNIGYKIFENLQKAKTILRDNNIEETNISFIRLKELLKNNMGYIGWFTNMLFNNDILLSDLENLYRTIVERDEIIKSLPKPLISYTDWEGLIDDLIKSENNINIKRVINELPTLQKSFINTKDENEKSLIIKLSKMTDRENLLKKVSRYKTKEELLKAISLFTTDERTIGYSNIKDRVIKSGARIVYDSHFDNIIICEVNFSQLKKLASDTSWCILQESRFDSYSNGINNQYIIFLTDLTDNVSKIGITYGVKFRTAHLINDQHISEEDVNKILLDRGTSTKVIQTTKEEILSKMGGIDKTSLSNLFDFGFTKEEVFKSKNVFSKRDSDYIQRNFSEDEVKKYDISDKIEISEYTINWRKVNADYLIDNKKRITFKMGLSRLDKFSMEDIDRLLDNDLLDDDFCELIKDIKDRRIDGNSSENVIRYIKRKKVKDISKFIFILKYGEVSPKDYNIDEIIDSIPLNEFTAPSSNLLSYLIETGFDFNEKSSMKLALKLNATYDKRMSFGSDRLECLDAWLGLLKLLPSLKDNVQNIIEEYIESKTIWKKDIENDKMLIAKKVYPELYPYLESSVSVRNAWVNIKDVLPAPNIMNYGINRRECVSYMRSKGREYNLITPQDVYDDFYDILKDEYYSNDDGLSSISTLHMISALVKTNNIENIGKMKIRWTFSFIRFLIQVTMGNKKYNGYNYINGDFILNKNERKSLFEYLLANIKDRLESGIRNEEFNDIELMKHKEFSLIYYIYDWGFNRYLELVKRSKNTYKDEWNEDGVDKDGRRLSKVKHSIIRIDYLLDVIKYLMDKGDAQPIIDILDDIMNNWKPTKKEVVMIGHAIYHINGDNFKVTKDKVVDWLFKNHVGMDKLRELQIKSRNNRW